MQGSREFLDREKCFVATHDVSARRFAPVTQMTCWRSAVDVSGLGVEFLICVRIAGRFLFFVQSISL